MKQNFTDTNIEPYPNPKPLRVERVVTEVRDKDGFVTGRETLIIRNANLDPYAIVGRLR
jgi:hypothetical protein